MAKLDLGLFGRSTVRHVRQTEVAECGLACLAMVAGYHGLDVDLNTLRRRHAPSLRGASLKSLIAVADDLGFASRPVKLPLDALADLHLPAVLHWDMNHYVVLERIERGRALILDPASGAARRMPLAEVSRHFTGVALELRPSTGFEPANHRQRLHLRHLCGRMRGWKRAAAQTLALTIVLQAYTLASPYYMQLALDSVVPALDSNLLAVLALGFGLFTVFNAGASLLRGFVLLSVGTIMGYTLATNLARRLFRLPVEWFERRHVGDVLSRFQSVQPIQDALTQGLVGSLVDGILAVLTFALMLWYSTGLALIALAAFLAYAVVRLISFGFERDAREAGIVTVAKEQSTLIETVRGIVTLRLFGREAERHVLWQNRLADATNAAIGVSRIGIWQQAANTLIFGLENVVTIWLAIRLVLSGGFSVGMVVAYLAYKQQFLTRAASLIDQGIAFRMLGLHLERLGDIALEDEDRGFAAGSGQETPFSGRIRLSGIMYRYSPTDPMILNRIDLDVPAGSYIAITGPSGGGKSTLAKLILGLVEPDEGEVLIDETPLHRFGHRNYQSQIAAVLQEDSLFAGSIADNIALFDDAADPERIMRSAAIAAIHHEIMAMPMKYESLVGDMGSALSGGQKARLLLARAIYRQPRLLLLDEGTAHLDAENEKVINRAIRDLNITRIVIAHRAETIESADYCLTLRDGKLT
ncbi:peptidase domain-containing ABC transporter [Sphingomonas sp. CD22]|uniref:peptidase domain-containing ABC transporter n=1 Tax=Sphingomonas sp. CD22 TaxID=3100214 RepID=UPI002ADF08CE|nr:peptidase domain-containing ABC transporter [Sphingomonas sp. CD22]MEA1083692.1 peptidase domain-containing ABC transporter [Sphingomonas sp. CD22]